MILNSSELRFLSVPDENMIILRPDALNTEIYATIL